jgi:ribosomal protein S18 acetylase RimI-like enzyme
MGIGCRPMRPGEEDVVAMMLRKLPADIGLDVVPKVTGQSLRDNAELLNVTVALDSGLLLGTCVWFMTYSTWRASKGMYVCDLYVMDHMRGHGVGEKLLRAATKDAAKLGATYIKLEVNKRNPARVSFYGKLKFQIDEDDDTLFLEPDDFSLFIEGQK